MRYTWILLLITGCASLKPPVIKREPDTLIPVKYTVYCEYETDCLRQIQDMEDGVEGGTVEFDESTGAARVEGVQRIRGKIIE
jgi:hypothetical protein